jgi:ligand-binding sensor domain-containing protein/signal transduction histidine kinase
MKFARRTGGGLVGAAVFTLPLLALNPAYQISQYIHTAWKSDSGLQAVRRLAQTPDGYLWLATRAGLVRFDGNRFTTYLAGSVPGLESSTTQDLLVDRDGSLWIATLGGGVSHYQQGRFRSYRIREGLPSDDISSLYRDVQGVLWVGTRDGKIARFAHGRFEKAPIVIPANSVSALLETADQSLWIATFGRGVFRLRDGVLTEFSVPQGLPDARVAGLCRDRSGKLWTAGWKGVSSWNGTQFVTDKAVGSALAYAVGCREDRDGNLWIAAASGLFRLRQGKVTKLNRDSGLSGDFASDVFEDRDGNLWTGTRGGLDRLQDGPVRTFTSKEGLLGDTGPIVIGEQGAIWTASDRQIARITGNDLAAWPLALPANGQAVSMLPQPGSQFLLGSATGVVRWGPRGAGMVSALEGMNVRCMLQARDGSVWIGTADRGLLRWKPLPESSASMEIEVADKSIVTLAQDRAGAIWAGSLFGGGLYRVESGKVTNFGPAEGLKSPNVYSVFADEKGDVWIGSTGGLSWLHNGQFRTVTSRQGLPADQILAIVGDSYDRLWFTTFVGVASVDKGSLIEWAENRRERLNPTVYRADAMQTYTLGRTFPNAVRSPDGHLWFSFGNGLAEVIPPRPGSSPEPQFPVLIEEINLDGIRHSLQDRLRIPAGTRSIEITYTAIALTNPESVRFRYQLRGIDRDWIHADSRRIAFYNNLQPGSYTFTVSASSGGGKWKDAPALVLEQAPFFYQTAWFMILAAAAAVSAAVLAYCVHVQRAIDRIQAGFQDRMDERTRIARDLHDTLLQSFQAVLLKFSTVKYVMRSRPDEAEEALERIIDQAREAVIEGRDAVQGLRSSTALTNDLARAIGTFGEGLAAEHTGGNCPEFRVHVEGKSRNLPPLVRDEVYRIACETLRNAFRHAHAQRIEVEIRYDPRQFRLRVVDNGKGIDPAVLSTGGRAGHHGLPGINERAELAGGKLSIWSRLDTGTEIELTIPGSIAYTKPLPDRRSMASGKGTG